MKVETFWNKAFLAALTRLPPEQAKKDADLATELCIEQWREMRFRSDSSALWKDQDIASASKMHKSS